MVPRPPIFDSHVLALNVSLLFQPLGERGQTGRVHLRRCTAEEADHRYTALLRARRQRPCHRAPKNPDELASFHGRPLKAGYYTLPLSNVSCITAKLAADFRDGSFASILLCPQHVRLEGNLGHATSAL